MDLRQGPRWTKSTTLSSGMVYELRVHAQVASEGSFPCFLPDDLHAGGERPMSLASDASAQSMRVEAPSNLGVFIGGVHMLCGVPWCVGHGAGLPGTTVASVRWLWPRRGDSVVRVSFTRLLRAQRCSSAALAASGGAWPRA